jgi:hypothetical protein
VRHRKRRLRNRGEGRPIAERRALIFFQNSSNKTPPPGKILSFPSHNEMVYPSAATNL